MPKQIEIDKQVASEAHDWARRIIRVEMAKRDLSYGGLAELLDKAGVHENERNLRNKVARGEFSAAFMLMCLKVMGVRDGYPIPVQHPANDLREGDRFEHAFAEAAKADSLRCIGVKLILTDIGKKMLEPYH